MKKKWQIAEMVNRELKDSFPEIGLISLQLLHNRNINGTEEISGFLSPDYNKDPYDPFLLRDMEVAVERILRAFQNNEKITIFGDYDADGVTSTVLLKKIFTEIGGKFMRNGSQSDKAQTDLVDVYIPHRGKEGYGLNNNALDFIKNNGTGLIITVDCGISNFEEIIYGTSLGLDIIITDHHHPPEKLPRAYAIINPKVMEEKYPFRELAGVGVGFKLVQALVKKLEEQYSTIFDKNYLEGVEKWLLDLVAIGTVADCCPLVGENRVFVKYGLLVLNKTINVGLKTLLEASGIAKNQAKSVVSNRFGKELSSESDIDTWSISFQLAPRLNAAGRLDHANTAYKLLITQDIKEAQEIAQKLNDTNTKRQILTEQAVKEAMEMIEKDQRDNFVLFVKGKWDAGIIGLIAGKLSEHYHRPAFAFTKIDSELVASGRSIPEFNLIEALEKVNKYLRRYGGHSQACGLSFGEEKFYDEFVRNFLGLAGKELEGKELLPILNIDALIKLDDISWKLWDELKSFEPYGEANPRPLFLIKDLKILEIKLVGQDGHHLKLKLQDASNKIINAIGFFLNDDRKNKDNCWGEKLRIEDTIDVVAYVDVNQWNGTRELQLKLVDIRISIENCF